MALVIGPARGRRRAAIGVARALLAAAVEAARRVRRAVRGARARDAPERSVADRLLSAAGVRTVRTAERSATAAPAGNDERDGSESSNEKRRKTFHDKIIGKRKNTFHHFWSLQCGK